LSKIQVGESCWGKGIQKGEKTRILKEKKEKNKCVVMRVNREGLLWRNILLGRGLVIVMGETRGSEEESFDWELRMKERE